MNMPIKTALITGAARRIGRQLSLDLADDGWNIAVHCSSSVQEANEVAGMIRSKGRQATVVTGNLADPVTPERLMAEAVREMGPVTALINNASIFEPDEVGNISAETWARHQNINLRSPV